MAEPPRARRERLRRQRRALPLLGTDRRHAAGVRAAEVRPLDLPHLERRLAAGRLPVGRPLRVQPGCRWRRRSGVRAGDVGLDDERGAPRWDAQPAAAVPEPEGALGRAGARRAGRPLHRLADQLHVVLPPLPTSEQQDYWRIYAAEAYANGLYFAFFLLDTVGDPSATQLGLMPFFQSLTAFYRAHAGLYHGVTASAASVTSAVTTSLDHAGHDRRQRPGAAPAPARPPGQPRLQRRARRARRRDCHRSAPERADVGDARLARRGGRHAR